MAAFVFSAANKVLQELGDLAYEEVRMAYGVKTELEKLRSTMGTVQLVLKDAEKKQASDENIRHWLKQLKDIFYDIEDVVDEFAAETLRAQVVNQESITQKVRHFFSASNPLAFRFRMSHRIKDVREKLDEIAAQKARFHELVEQGNDDKSLMHKERYRDTTYSYVQTSNVIGRDEDRKKIIKTLIGFNNLTARNVSVVPIVGIGGLGKTSLTKLVYNNEQVVKHFPCRMWVCVSQNFVVSNVLKDMIKSATGEDCDKFNMEQLHKCLRDALLGKRFLLVLDDVWSDDRQTWMDLMGLLEVGDSGSKVIVTTRSPQVANVMGGTNNVSTHDLKGLSPKESMSLFVQWAFGDPKAAKRHPELLEIGEEIVTKCKGVPLAVRTVGSLLYSKRDKRDWLLIKNNGIWELEQSENDILPALRLSYDEMPSHLKRCFVYCSIFPKRFEFDSEDLIQFWMAHNLIRSPNKDQDLEEVGEQYVKELWMRSFFEDFRDRGYYYTFSMHDLIHDLCLSMAQNDCSIVYSAAQEVDESVRHLSFTEFELPNGQQVPKCLSMLRNVRTITFPEVDILFQSLDNQSFVDACIPRFKYLRFLDLSNSSFEVLPSSISKLIHLRYFDISVNQRIEKLPKAVSKLQSLQTFRFSGCSELVKLPDGMRNLISLRHLTLTTQEERLTDSGIGNITSLRSLVLAACENLENLIDMHLLVNLRSLSIVLCPSLEALPRSILGLPALETLVIQYCNRLNLDFPEESVGPSRLRTLKLGGLPELLALPLWIQASATTLRYIKIEGSYNLTELPVWTKDLSSLNTLKLQACPELKSLPEGMKQLTSLNELSISSCIALSARCYKGGADWEKIAHVPVVKLDGITYNSSK